MDDGPTIRVRGQDFSEAITIAEVYGQYPRRPRATTSTSSPRPVSGSRPIDGIANGDLDLIIDYIGGAQANLAARRRTLRPIADTVVAATLEPAFADIGGTILDYSPAVDGDAFVVRGDLDATAISDVADIGPRASVHRRSAPSGRSA